MKNLHLALCLASALTAACASAPSEERAPATRIIEPMTVVPSEAAGPAPLAARPPSAGEIELALWNDPAFRRRFAESYAAETEVEPRVTDLEREPLQQVLDLLASGQLEQAANLLAKHRTSASSAVFDFTLGNIRFQQEDSPRAVAAYRIAVDKHPKFLRAWRNLGQIHVRQGEFAEAVPALTRVIELGGGDATSYGLLGFAYSKLGNDLSAESAYRMAILLDPATMDWKMGLARSLFEEQRFADAVALCQTLIEAEPDRSDLWLLQANAYVGLGMPLKAAENYELVDRMGGSTPDSLNMLGDIYVNDGLHELAVDSYVRAMEKRPEAGAERAVRAAKVLAARGALGETRRLAESIERIQGERLGDDGRKDLLKLRARVAVAEGAGEEQAHVLEEIVALDPLDGEALVLLGQHYNREGDPERAIFYFERAASLEAFEADAKVGHAQLLVGQGRYAEALPLLRRAQTLNPRENVQDYLEQVERVAQAR